MLRVITMTAYRRPAYTREVLAALAQCDGIADWLLLPNVEPGHEEVINAFRQWSACESRLAVNKERMGLNRNTQEALVRAMLLRAAVIVHLEDDTVPSPDALRYFDWAVREMLIPDVKSKDGHQITLASGYNKPKSQPGPDQSHACDTRPIWTPWGWAMDRSRLAWLLANWCTGNPKCFTCKIKAQYRRTRREVFPVLSRIQNIGYDQGENGRTAEWYRANHRTHWVADSVPPKSFLILGSTDGLTASPR
jgi:hypothetical protein